MAIVITPNKDVTGVVGVPTCFTASANIVLAQQDKAYANLPASGTNWTWTPVPNGVWTNVSGTPGDWSTCFAIVPGTVYGLQPFEVYGINHEFFTPASPNRFYACQWGVLDDQGRRYAWYLWKNCGSQIPANCSGPNTSNSKWTAFFLVDDVPVGSIIVNFREEFRLRSDGTRLHWDRKTGGIWQLSQYTINLPESDYFQFEIRSAYPANTVNGFATFKGSFVGQVPTIWTAPLGGTITGTGGNRCLTGGSAGTYQICVASEFDAPVCVDIEVDDLYLNPVDFQCGDCAYTNQIVQFESNGGYAGTLTADAGTVIDSLTWQAPSVPGSYILTYSISGYSIDCVVNVVEQFKALNVVGNEIRGLLPGDTFKILTNYDFPNGEVTWENLTCKNIVQPDGTVVIPKPNIDNCFGQIECTIRARLEHIENQICSNLTGISYLDFTIYVDPVYPTPDIGGPGYIKWKPETPDYRTIVNEFEGGCDETYIKSNVAVYKWMVRYDGLSYDEPCAPVPCCDEPQGVPGGYSTYYQSAARLDEFWNLVRGKYGYFTLIEPRTGKVWERVRFDTTMERDHINWRSSQSRNFSLVWRPCCATEPAGGLCPHKTIVDNMFPGPPQKVGTSTVSDSWIKVLWQAALDNVGIKGYEVEIDGLAVIDVGHSLVYDHKNLPSNSEHSYRVRAYDFSGNRSEWSAPTIGTTYLQIQDSGVNVEESGDPVIEG